MLLGLFVMQPWAPRLSDIPVQIILVWLVFIWFLLFRSSLVFRSLTIFSKTQWLSIGVIVVSISIRSALDGWDVLRLGQMVTGLVIALAGSAIFQSKRGRNTVLILLSLAAVVSSIVALLQYFDFAPWLWERTKYVGRGYVYGSTGLELSPVPFAYSVVGICMVLIGSWLLSWRLRIKVFSWPTGVVFIFSLIILAGLIVSNSRSGLLGIVLGIILVLLAGRLQTTRRSSASHRFAGRTNWGWMMLTAYIVIIGMLVLSVYAATARDAELFQDARITSTWQAYFPLIWRNPIGLTGGADLLEALTQADSLNNASLVRGPWGEIISPHNLLLTIGISYGPSAMLALFVLYVTAFRDGLRASSFLKNAGHVTSALLIIVLLAANIAIVAHSWFHNASIALGEMRNWVWLGFLLTASKIPSQENDPS